MAQTRKLSFLEAAFAGDKIGAKEKPGICKWENSSGIQAVHFVVSLRNE